jgi:hypothetical protein
LANIKPQEDRAILMICIGIALVFWILVKLSQVYRVWKPAQVNIEVPENMALTKMPPDNLMLKFEARGWDLLFSSKNLSKLDLNYSMGEETELMISAGQLRSDVFEDLSSTRLKVVDVNYNELYLNLDDRLEKKIPLILNKKIEFAEDFNFSNRISLSPDSITISGPQELIQTIFFWETDSLTLLELNSTVEKVIPLFSAPRELLLSEAHTTVKVPVEKFTEKSFFIQLEIKNAPEKDSLSIFPSSVNVSCTVGLSKFDQLQSNEFKFEVDLGIAHLSEGKNTAPIMLVKRPDYVKGVNYSPKSATFYIIKKLEPEPETNK